MREIWIGTGAAVTETEVTVTCEYRIIVRELEDAMLGESYGIKVTLLESGETLEISDITVNATKMFELAEQLRRNLITPCTLREVLEDWL